MGKNSSVGPILLHHLDHLGEDDFDVEEMLDSEEAMSYVTALKDEANALFKFKKFSTAFVMYNKGIKCLCVIICAISDDSHMCEVSLELKELAFNLHLNIAASAIKLNKFRDAITSCSLILESNKRNVKALFRRGVALEKLGDLEKAFNDFKSTKEIEPNNKEIGKELTSLREVVFRKQNGNEEKSEENMHLQYGEDQIS
ncbi:peptidyl-prolyl cis-trans isomerase FKBP42-like [Chenopodium quinoa]|uniref:peptidyl-prolyl cis-trans isomerase FKBP42-like n=1 Tax=Chenopodium quinoa TaxID=63459 RepID=UPI000B776F69|nr:peptidyl-prolyl cis-trans isomerase FKBP42-like [Chenopodium quinoa]